jgi:hypothetical protein
MLNMTFMKVLLTASYAIENKIIVFAYADPATSLK